MKNIIFADTSNIGIGTLTFYLCFHLVGI